MDAFLEGARLVFDPYVLMVMVAAASYGISIGAIPGLTATMAVALLIPITFFMDPIPALGAIITTCSAPGSLDTSLSHAAGLSEIAACHA